MSHAPTTCHAAPAARNTAAPTASTMLAQLAAGKTTASRIVAEHLERIGGCEPEVRAWAWLDGQAAAARAARIDGGARQGWLSGIPIGIKDNIDTCDMPTGYGSPIHEGFRPARDAACVAALRLAGANPLGKTVSTEFAHRAPGPTTNPWNAAHTPGGSSSGSAAAVGSGMVALALGSQTTGSVIRPAAYCGVVGYKPTYGTFNVAGMLPNTPAFDTLGVMARCVEDLALVRRALLDDSVVPPAPANVAGLRIGVCPTPWWGQAERETQALLERAAAALEAAGARVSPFDDGGALDGLDEPNLTVSGYEFARTLAHERRVAHDRLSAQLRDGRMADGLRARYADYVAATRHIEGAREAMDRALARVDLLITPAAPGPAPAGLQHTGSAVFNMPWTTLHTPAVTLPVARSRDGLPLGLQLIAARHADDALLARASSVFALFGREPL